MHKLVIAVMTAALAAMLVSACDGENCHTESGCESTHASTTGSSAGGSGGEGAGGGQGGEGG